MVSAPGAESPPELPDHSHHADGQLEGWLGSSTPTPPSGSTSSPAPPTTPTGQGKPRTTFGSMEVTTDATGQVVFTVPSRRPGCQSSRPRPPTPRATPPKSWPFVGLPWRHRRRPFASFPTSLGLSTGGPGFAIQDPDAGPLNPVWSLALSVSDGTLSLSSTAGLTGSATGPDRCRTAVRSRPWTRRWRPDLHSARRPARLRHPRTRCPVQRRPAARDAIRDHGRRLGGRQYGRRRPRLAPPGDPGRQYRA